jgi:Ferritin-like domain
MVLAPIRSQQEKVHIESLTNLLDDYNISTIPPYNYSFPMESMKDFFNLAQIITSVGIGATIGLTECLAVRDPLLIRRLSSILTAEFRHDAFFRSVKGKVPNPTPFDPCISDLWAYNLALSFVVPGSCSVEVPLPILPKLTIAQPTAMPSVNPTASYANTTTPYTNTTEGLTKLEFIWDPMQTPFSAESGKQLLIVWVNQLNVPVYTTLKTTATGKGTACVP